MHLINSFKTIFMFSKGKFFGLKKQIFILTQKFSLLGKCSFDFDKIDVAC